VCNRASYFCVSVNIAEMSGLVLHLLGHSSHLSVRARKNPSNGHSSFDFNRVQVSGKKERERDGWKVGQTQNCDSHDIILNVTEKHKNEIVYFTLLFFHDPTLVRNYCFVSASGWQAAVLKLGLLRC